MCIFYKNFITSLIFLDVCTKQIPFFRFLSLAKRKTGQPGHDGAGPSHFGVRCALVLRGRAAQLCVWPALFFYLLYFILQIRYTW